MKSFFATRAGAATALVVTMLIWGGSIPVTKAAVADVPPVLLAFLRFAIASALLWPVLIWRSRAARAIGHANAAQVATGANVSPAGGGQAPNSSVRWRDAFVLGATGIALYYLGYNVGLLYTSASQAALLQSAVPAITAVLAFFWLHERVGLLGGIGTLASIAGVLVILVTAKADASAPNPWLGNGLVAAAVVAWAVYTIVAKRVAEADALVVILRTSIAGALLLLPAVAVEYALGLRATWSPLGLASLAYLAGVSSALGYGLYAIALRVLGAGQVSTYLNLMPIVAVSAAALFLGERIDMSTVIGGAIVLAGITLTTLAPAPAPQRRI